MGKPKGLITSPAKKPPGLDLTRMPDTHEGRRVKQAADGKAAWRSGART